MTFILQWNINGLVAHLEKLKYLITKQSPEIMCVQETNFKDDYCYQMKNYVCFNKNRLNVDRASGGVATYIREGTEVEEIQLTTDIEAVAVTVRFSSTKISIINLYIPPHKTFTRRDLQNVINQTPTPRIIVGDFNSDNTLWGSKNDNNRGKEVEEFISSESIILLNTGQGTRFNSYTGDFSCLDLSMCDATISPYLTWYPMSYLYGSDHLPICINHAALPNAGDSINRNQKWNLKAADWDNFRNYILTELLQLQPNGNVDDDLEIFKSLIITAANAHIGMTKVSKRTVSVPWWSPDCAKVMRDSKRAFYKAKRIPTPENLVEFKRLRAIARAKFKQAKRDSWNSYVSTITPSTPSSVIWNKIRKIKGASSSHQIRSITHKNKSITTTEGIAEAFAGEFSRISSDENYDDCFLRHKNTTENTTPLDHHTNYENPLNAAITYEEFEDALRTCKNSAPGPDSIPYCFIEHLPLNAKKYLLDLYNEIFSSHHFPCAC